MSPEVDAVNLLIDRRTGERSRTGGNYGRRVAVSRLDLDAWPFKIPTGYGDLVDARADKARQIAFQLSLQWEMLPALTYRRLAKMLVVELSSLAKLIEV